MTPDPDAYMAESQADTTGDASERAISSRVVPTLGERLAQEVRRTASRRIPNFPWLHALQPVMERVASLPVPSETRFRRIEVPRPMPSLRVVSHEPFTESGSWPSSQSLPSSAVQEPLIGEGAQVWSQPSSSSIRKEPLVREDAQVRGQPLSPYVQQRLQDFVGPGTEAIRVHSEEAADAIARMQSADAVTVGQHVFFRQGRFRPHTDEGFALLTHEAIHVVQAMRPGNTWRRGTQVGVQEEEQEARVQEHNALQARRQATFLPQLAPPAQRSAPASRYPIRSERGSLTSGPTVPSSPVHRPMAAPADRNLDNAVPPAPAMPDVEDLKRTLYRDLMRQIRADLERGG